MALKLGPPAACLTPQPPSSCGPPRELNQPFQGEAFQAAYLRRTCDAPHTCAPGRTIVAGGPRGCRCRERKEKGRKDTEGLNSKAAVSVVLELAQQAAAAASRQGSRSLRRAASARLNAARFLPEIMRDFLPRNDAPIRMRRL